MNATFRVKELFLPCLERESPGEREGAAGRGPCEADGKRIGPYKPLQRLGEGSQTGWRARRRHPQSTQLPGQFPTRLLDVLEGNVPDDGDGLRLGVGVPFFDP